MKDFYKDLGSKEPLRQGDVLISRNARDPKYLFLVTADCDIAQNKYGDSLTCLPIISAMQYIEIWCAGRLPIFVSKSASSVSKQIFDADRNRDPLVSKLTQDEIIKWLLASGANSIVSLITFPDKKSALRCEKEIIHLSNLINEEKSALDRLKIAWEAAGKSVLKKSEELSNALSGMKDDWFFIPHMPGSDGVGYVVDLRRPIILNSKNVFPTEADARCGMVDGESYVRSGRYNDYIRFGVAQSFAFLFARIGMIGNFEQERSIAIEQIISGCLDD